MAEPHPRVSAALPSGPLKVWRHADLGPIASPWDFARAAGVEPDQVLKTVLLAERGKTEAVRLAQPERRYAGAVLPFRRRIALPAVAGAMGWSACEMARPEELEAATGYPRFGVSPLGLPCRVFVDIAILAQPSVFIGAGAAGVELELQPQALVEALETSPMTLTA